jgi:hypothetical protein
LGNKANKHVLPVLSASVDISLRTQKTVSFINTNHSLTWAVTWRNNKSTLIDEFYYLANII